MATNGIPINVSDSTVNISLGIRNNRVRRTVDTDSGNPYYVGARAYVTQNDDGATITVIDKEGTTTANIYNGDTVEFVGTDGIVAGKKGAVPAPSTDDADKFLNADGSWANVAALSNQDINNMLT